MTPTPSHPVRDAIEPVDGDQTSSAGSTWPSGVAVVFGYPLAGLGWLYLMSDGGIWSSETMVALLCALAASIISAAMTGRPSARSAQSRVSVIAAWLMWYLVGTTVFWSVVTGLIGLVLVVGGPAMAVGASVYVSARNGLWVGRIATVAMLCVAAYSCSRLPGFADDPVAWGYLVYGSLAAAVLALLPDRTWARIHRERRAAVAARRHAETPTLRRGWWRGD